MIKNNSIVQNKNINLQLNLIGLGCPLQEPSQNHEKFYGKFLNKFYIFFWFIAVPLLLDKTELIAAKYNTF